MSSLVLKQLPLLELLTKVSSDSRKKILKHSDLELTEAIIECIFNVIKKNIDLENARMKKLRRHKTTISHLINPKKKLENKRKLMLQSGGSFLPLILTPVVSYLIDKIIS